MGGNDSRSRLVLQVKLLGKGILGELKLECSRWKRDPWASFEKKKSDWAWHDWSFAGAMDSELWMLWTLWTLCAWDGTTGLDIYEWYLPFLPQPQPFHPSCSAFVP